MTILGGRPDARTRIPDFSGSPRGGIQLTGLDQLRVADITYLRLLEEFAFLAVALDEFSRRVSARPVELHLRAGLAAPALEMALAVRRQVPGQLIHHSDRGVQCACAA